jgi:hypothetical protein
LRSWKKCERKDIPLSCEVLGDDGDESFEGSEDSSVNHDWTFELRGDVGVCALVGASVSEVESLGKVEVELDVSSST